MIRYPITEAELWAEIQVLCPNWHTRSQERTAEFIQAGEYNEASNIWGEVKPVYMKLQHAKCGYCERWLEHIDFGSIEHDMEHYRPKSNVRAYPPTASDTTKDPRAALSYSYDTGAARNTGYFRLAYHPLNYLTACKTCNTILKSDFFPIGGKRKDKADHPHDLKSEKPFLPYPIGDFDADPEALIGFDGILAIPVGKTPAQRRRAEITIDFFQLNNREDLRRERATIICALYNALERRRDTSLNDAQKQFVTRSINKLVSSKASHSNCARCFARLHQRDPHQSFQLADAASQLQIK